MTAEVFGVADSKFLGLDYEKLSQIQKNRNFWLMLNVS